MRAVPVERLVLAPFSLAKDVYMHRWSIVFIFAAGLVFIHVSVLAQAVEGKVELPRHEVETVTNQRYQLKPDQSTRAPDPPTAVVYLEGVPVRKESDHPFAKMAQKDINFTPNLLAILVGTTVEFPNLDDTYHNVFSYSKTKRFDLGRYRKDEKPGVVIFDKAGVVNLHCEIHSAMRGTILVLDTPYFEKTNTKGEFQLKNLPPGHFLLKAWVSENDVREQPVDLKPGATTHIDFPGR